MHWFILFLLNKYLQQCYVINEGGVSRHLEKMFIQRILYQIHRTNQSCSSVCLSADWHVAGLLSVQDHYSQSV